MVREVRNRSFKKYINRIIGQNNAYVDSVMYPVLHSFQRDHEKTYKPVKIGNRKAK